MRDIRFAFLLSLGLIACDRAPTQSSAGPSAVVEETRPAVVRVADRSLTCMVNDMYMGSPQIPVPVQGKTYFGCCDMCKQRLAEDASARAARDPISGRVVDKAAAVIGKTNSGALVYFESSKNLERFATSGPARLQ